MSKTKLDAALLGAMPVAGPAKPDTFETLWENFGGPTRHVACNTRLVLIQSKDWQTADKLVNLMQSWDSIPHVVGLVHRMIEEGLNPLVKLGMERSQQDQFNTLCRAIREKLVSRSVVSGQTEQRTTLTKQIHDSLIANHF